MVALDKGIASPIVKSNINVYIGMNMAPPPIPEALTKIDTIIIKIKAINFL